MNRDRELVKRDRSVGFRILLAVSVVLLIVVSVWLIRRAATGHNSARLSFNQTIQPILSENCYACHGPDPGARKAGLRLDRAEFAFAAHEKFGPAIVRGNPDSSPLVKRIESKDPKERMPPPEGHRTLEAGADRAAAPVGERGRSLRRALVVHPTQAPRCACQQQSAVDQERLLMDSF